MNKNLLAMTALAAMLFAGCTSSDDLTTRETITKANEAATPINFGTYMGKTGTRAGAGGDIAPITTPSTTATKVLADKGGFGVFAYYTGADNYSNTVNSGSQTPNFMYNQAVTSTDGSAWTYSPVKYWPNQYNEGNVDNKQGSNEDANATAASNAGKVSFFAYAPYVSASEISSNPGYGITALSANTSGYDPTVSYKLAADGVGNFVDLLWGVKVNGSKEATPVADTYNVNLTKNSTDLTSANKDGKVSFLFKHALTKVGGSTGLKIVYDIDANGSGATGGGSDDDNTLVTVSDITIKNAAGNIIKTGVLDLATGDWAASVDATASEGDLINLHFTKDGAESTIPLNTAIAETTPANSGTGWTSPTGGGVKASAAKDIYNAAADPFYLIPGDNDQKLNVTITYIVRTYDENLATSASGEGTWTKVTQTISNVVTLPTEILKPNKKITLVLHLGLTSVKFTAKVDSWEAVEGASAREVWLPSNVVPAPAP